MIFFYALWDNPSCADRDSYLESHSTKTFIGEQSGFSLCENKNNSTDKMLPRSRDRTKFSHNLWFQVQHNPFWTNLAFTCKTETLGSLYSNALLIPIKSSMFKNQVVHEQKFKVAHVSLGMRGPGSIPTVEVSRNSWNWYWCQYWH